MKTSLAVEFYFARLKCTLKRHLCRSYVLFKYNPNDDSLNYANINYKKNSKSNFQVNMNFLNALQDTQT